MRSGNDIERISESSFSLPWKELQDRFKKATDHLKRTPRFQIALEGILEFHPQELYDAFKINTRSGTFIPTIKGW